MRISSRSILVLILACGLSGWSLFNNASLFVLLESEPQSVEWYGVFANQIFHPFQTYISESVLLPLIAKITGAGTSRSSWLVLCAIALFLVVPILTAIAIAETKSAAKGLVFLMIIFPLLNLRNLPLGFPDPMTIMMLGIAALQRGPKPLLFGAFFASTSHFSLSIFSLIGLAVVIFCDLRAGLTIAEKKRRIYYLLLGALAGKVFVGLWHLLLNYHAESRLQWALNHGVQEFWKRYVDDPTAFWLTPGISFLIIYAIILCALAWSSSLRLAIAGVAVLVIAYIANYLALDGMRIFTTAVSASLVYLTLRLVESINVSQPVIKFFYDRFAWMEANAQYLHRLSFTALISMSWLYLLSAAQWAGFGINFISETHLGARYIYWAYFFLAASFSLIAIFAHRLNGFVFRLATTIYLGLIFLVVIQWIRGGWWPDLAMAAWLKVTLLICICGLSYYLSDLLVSKNLTTLMGAVQRPAQRALDKS